MNLGLFWGEVGEGVGVLNVVIGNLSTAEGGKVGTGIEGLADVFGESADVGAGAAVDADG